MGLVAHDRHALGLATRCRHPLIACSLCDGLVHRRPAGGRHQRWAACLAWACYGATGLGWLVTSRLGQQADIASLDPAVLYTRAG